MSDNLLAICFLRWFIRIVTWAYKACMRLIGVRT